MPYPDEPYPIRTRGDVNRARVLPPPRTGGGKAADAKPAPKAAAKAPATDTDDDDLMSGRRGARDAGENIKRRNKMLKGIRYQGRRRRAREHRA